MELANIFGLKAKNMKVNFLMIKRKAMVIINGLMVEGFKVGGTKVNSMVLVFTRLQNKSK